MKPSGIGGMAVIEGVMMKNKNEYAVAVRKPNNEIAVEKNTHKDFADKVKLFKLPIFRGMLTFVDSLVIGMKVLNFSASFFEDEEQESKKEKDKRKAGGIKHTAKEDKEDNASNEVSAAKDEVTKGKSDAVMMAAAVFVSLLISISLFMVLPVIVSNFFETFIDSTILLSLLEGVLRLIIFIGYILLASMMKEIKRVFMYHGAEHKTINCLENGFELTLENVRWQSRQNKRCGTSFMLLVMVISLLFFMVLRPGTLWLRILSRVLLVPFIAGLSYEFIRLAGKSDNIVVNILSKPGLWLQALTTREPDDSMMEVAIRSVDAVFDWRSFLETAAAEDKKGLKAVKASKKISVKPSDISETNTQETISASLTDYDDKYRKKEKQENTAIPADRLRFDSSHRARPIEIKFKERDKADDEDDEILRALDKYLDFNDKTSSRDKKDRQIR